MRTKILTDEQYKILSKKLIDSIEKHYKIVPLNTLKHPHYSLKKPIYITIETEDDKVIASLDDIEAFAYADTEFEAINSLCEEIIDIYEDLKKDKKNLGILPKKWLAYLKEVIETK
ncbi:MAG: hypothetical protein ACUZ77_08895 [Candidatus Brocadiales bacterium]